MQSERRDRDHSEEIPNQRLPFYDFSGWLANNPDTNLPYFELDTREGRQRFAEALIKEYLPTADVQADREIAQGSGNGWVIRVRAGEQVFFVKIRNVEQFGRNLDLDDGDIRARTQARLFMDFVARHHNPQVEESEFLFPVNGFFSDPHERFVGYIMPECSQGTLDDRYVAIKLRHQDQENASLLPPLTWKQVTNLVRHYLSTLVFYESCHVRHRDQKCENVYIDANGHAFLADADYMGFDDVPFTLGKMDGFTNILFMSPETVNSRNEEQPAATQQSEQYSAALVLYRALSRGRYPFFWKDGWEEADFQTYFAERQYQGKQESMGHVITKMSGYYRPLTEIFFAHQEFQEHLEPTQIFQVVQKIDQILAKALSLKPEERFTTNLEFARELMIQVHHLSRLIEEQVHQTGEDPLWADPGKSVGRMLPRYQEKPAEIEKHMDRQKRSVIQRLVARLKEI